MHKNRRKYLQLYDIFKNIFVVRISANYWLCIATLLRLLAWEHKLPKMATSKPFAVFPENEIVICRGSREVCLITKISNQFEYNKYTIINLERAE